MEGPYAMATSTHYTFSTKPFSRASCRHIARVLEIQYHIRGPSQCNETMKREKSHPSGKEEIKIFLFPDGMMVFIEKSQRILILEKEYGDIIW